MGKLTNGAFGPLTGKVGNMVSYMLNGQNITRMNGKSKKPFTIPQKNNLLQMKVINKVLQDMRGFLRAGFGPACKDTVCNFQNLAVKHNKPQALTGYYPEVAVDFSKLLVSYGNVPQPVDAKAELVPEGLKFTWDVTNQSFSPSSIDQVMMLAYFPERGTMAFNTSGAKRDTGFDLLPLNALQKNYIMEVYIAFRADDRNDVSESLYLGRIVPA